MALPRELPVTTARLSLSSPASRTAPRIEVDLAPHVAGVVISTGARASRPGPDETVMLPAPVGQLVLPAAAERQRQMRIAPVGMLRALPGGRLRGSFILPAYGRSAGAGLADTAACTIRSRTVGMDNGRRPVPPGLGMNSRRAGSGRHLPSFRSAASSIGTRPLPGVNRL